MHHNIDVTGNKKNYAAPDTETNIPNIKIPIF